MSLVYLAGSLRNPQVPALAKTLEGAGLDVFVEWFNPGPETDQYWQAHQQYLGRRYVEALYGPHAQHVLAFDKHWLDKCDAAVVLYPAGKSAHLELGYVIGQGKPGYVLLDGEPERWDVMLGLATRVFESVTDLLRELR